jgi:hypothetical protein
MIVDIFIRTYDKDIKWLEHSLRSIQKHVTGYRNIVIAIPNAKLLSHLTLEKVIEVEDLADGYIGQQFTKLTAYQYTDADAVIFWDSDVIACEPVDVGEWIKDGKPIIYKTPFELTQTPWKIPTEKAVGFEVEYEYMRRLPLPYLTSTLKATCKYVEDVHKVTLKHYLNHCTNRAFSEFNVIGAYAERFESKNYTFIDTETVSMPKNKVRQFWSWGGITDEVMKEINTYL